jgi:hypothetical protein
MFKNSDNDSDTEAGHTHSGRSFREVPLVNMFKQSYGPLAQDKDSTVEKKLSYQTKSIHIPQG